VIRPIGHTAGTTLAVRAGAYRPAGRSKQGRGPGQLRHPGGCLVTLAVHQREIEEGTGRFPHQGPGRPRAVFSRFGVDLRIPVEQHTDVCPNLRGRRLGLAADVAGMQTGIPALRFFVPIGGAILGDLDPHRVYNVWMRSTTRSGTENVS